MSRSLTEFKESIKFVLTDIDDTITDEGQLGPEAYAALWRLQSAGFHVIPVTGRPAGWCEMIARFWPISGIIGENGGFYFRYTNRQMIRHFFCSPELLVENRLKLDVIQKEILKKIPNARVASDQFCRLMDLAIDFCEDVSPPLNSNNIQEIVKIFESYGAQAKVSSIHVNGWFGSYDKVTMALYFLNREFGLSSNDAISNCAYVGDSPNDEPMFARFQNTFGVANIEKFLPQMKAHPSYIAPLPGGRGFSLIANQIIQSK